MSEVSGRDEPNRLFNEKSPYLLQHARNPVDWHVWGEEAFALAETSDRPLFISIGYSTCHWCHVMARESFEDREVAEILNRDFVPIKVDREERPDVDHIYMKACQLMTGSGGWPLTVIATPDRKPFFAGTYFPKTSRFGLPGLLNVLEVVGGGWKTDKAKIVSQAEKIYASLAKPDPERAAAEAAMGFAGSRDALLKSAFESYRSIFDEKNGGFGMAPKFPAPHNLMFLLRHWKRTGDKRALEMVEKTVRGMYAGGLYDHLGFGFFRYSTDATWTVPHFEKMLYDNALMLRVLVELWQASKRDTYKDMAFEVASFIRDEMTAPEGAFMAAIDAESEGEEGRYYVWKPSDTLDALGEDDADVFNRRFGIPSIGKGPVAGRWVPRLDLALESLTERGPTEERIRRKALAAREARPKPAKDDKILTAWNGLAIASLAKAYTAFRDGTHLDMAETAYKFIRDHLVDGDVVYARYRDGEVAHRGYLDDYAFSLWAVLELYQATFNAVYLDQGLTLANAMIERFHVTQDGESAFYMTESHGADLLIRPRETYDGAIPSGNSVAVYCLFRLSHLFGTERFEEIASSVLSSTQEVRESPSAHGLMLCAVNYAGEARDIVLNAGKDDPMAEPMIGYVRSLFLPDAQLVYAGDRDASVPQEEERFSITMCKHRACGPPIYTMQDLQLALMTPSRDVPPSCPS